MKYTLHPQPFYPYETIAILMAITNKDSIKKERERVIERRGQRYKAAITAYFKDHIALENYVAKNIPQTETTQFLFERVTEGDSCLAHIFVDYHLLKGKNKGYAILESFNEENPVFGDEINIVETPTSAEFFTHLDKLSIPDTAKLATLRLYHNFDYYHSCFNDLVAQVTALIQEKFPMEKIPRLVDYLDTQLQAKGMGFFKDAVGVAFDNTSTYNIYPSVVYPHSLSAHGTTSLAPNIMISLHIFDMAEKLKMMESSAEKTEELLRILSDPTKLAILKLLKNGPMYSAQIAEVLNCTTANVSHHISPLVSQEVVTVQKQGTRLYLHLNRDTLLDQLEGTKELFL